MTEGLSATRRPHAASDVAIVLTGGGARAAYQVGFLRWIARHIPEAAFPIVTGVSAGAINAAYLAAYPGSHTEAVEQLALLWRRLTVDKIFRVDSSSLLSHLFRWALRLVSGGGAMAPQVRGLVDTQPLRDTLHRLFDLTDHRLGDRVDAQLDARRVRALAIGTSSYTTGQTVVWTQGRDLSEWERPRRVSRATQMTIEHVMASASLPLFFPAVELENEWYGDGAIRLTAPCSPAIHLGATRILALSTQHLPTKEEVAEPMVPGYPPPAQILGQLLNAVFLDDLARDAKELQRINRLLEESPPEKRRGFRAIDLLIARPSQDLGQLVTVFEPRLPGLFRYLVRSLGASETSRPDLLSLLMFEPEYINALMEIGETDAAAHADDLRALLLTDEPDE